MPDQVVIVDTGPLVAFLMEQEPRHAWAVEQFKLLPAPFLTCEAVLTEAFHFLRRGRDGIVQFFELLHRGVVAVDFDLVQERAAVKKLVERYQDLPMSLADACLVRMAEMIDHGVVLTLDSHFTVYRKHRRRIISTILPPRE